jgi:hypothetical protein
MTDHGACEPMPGVRRLSRLGTGETRGHVGCGEAVARRRRINDIGHRLGSNLVVDTAGDDPAGRRRQFQHQLGRRTAGQELLYALAAE